MEERGVLEGIGGHRVEVIWSKQSQSLSFNIHLSTGHQEVLCYSIPHTSLKIAATRSGDPEEAIHSISAQHKRIKKEDSNSEQVCINEILPPEVIDVILRFADMRRSPGVMSFVCCFVCKLWRNILHPLMQQWRQRNPIHKIHRVARGELCKRMVGFGRIPLLEWARRQGCCWDERTSMKAASMGNLELLKWAWLNGCPLDDAMGSAASKGNIAICKWAKKKGTTIIPTPGFFAVSLGKGGNIKLLRWAKRQGLLKGGEYLVSHGAASNGNWKFLKHATGNGCRIDALTFRAAIKHGKLKILKWLKRHGCKWDKKCCQIAAEEGQLDILIWLKKEGCRLDENICSYASERGHLHVLQWARENGCPWDSETCSNAAFRGDLKMLEWARENGCPWDSGTGINAAIGGHFDVFKWALEHGCPCDDWIQQRSPGDLNIEYNVLIQTLEQSPALEILKRVTSEGGPLESCSQWGIISREATRQRRKDMLKWIIYNSPLDKTGCFCSIPIFIAELGELDFFKKVMEYGFGWDAGVCHAAAEVGSIDILQWATQNGCPIDLNQCMDAAIKQGHAHVIRWLLEKGAEWKGLQRLLPRVVQLCFIKVLDLANTFNLNKDKVKELAIKNGRLEVLIWWQRESGKEFTHSDFVLAVANGQLGVLQWMKKKGIKMDVDNLLGTAIGCHNSKDLVKWLLDQSPGWKWPKKL